jgi:hypothetical protein
MFIRDEEKAGVPTKGPTPKIKTFSGDKGALLTGISLNRRYSLIPRPPMKSLNASVAMTVKVLSVKSTDRIRPVHPVDPIVPPENQLFWVIYPEITGCQANVGFI